MSFVGCVVLQGVWSWGQVEAAPAESGRVAAVNRDAGVAAHSVAASGVLSQGAVQPIPATVDATPAVGDSKATVPVVVGKSEDHAAGGRAIVRPSGDATGSEAAQASSASALYEVGRVVLSLVMVLALIVALKFGASKFLGVRNAVASSNKGVRVLSRTMIQPKQHLLLLQVGRKLVLVADSAGSISTVCEITDPDEVAELSAQAMGKTESGGMFGRLFQRQSSEFQESTLLQEGETLTRFPARSRFEDDVDLMDSPAEPDRPSREQDFYPAASRREAEGESNELNGLAQRIRALGQQFASR